MGHRVSWRSRPRADFPFRQGIGTTTAAAMAQPAGGSIGPLTLQAAVELLWRVSKLTVTGEVTYGESMTFYLDDVAERTTSEATRPTMTETIVLKNNLAGCGLTFLDSDWIANADMQYEDSIGFDYFETGVWTDTITLWAMSATLPNVAKDENDDYWILGKLWIFNEYGAAEFSSHYPTLWNFTDGSFPASNVVSVDLVLNSGTFPIDLNTGYGWTVHSQGGTDPATITATEWFPYATKAPADAWDTATGDPANGGPGA